MTNLARVVLGLLTVPFLWAGSPAQESSESQIRAVLANQSKDWNDGDLEGFMEGYWEDPGLTFFSGGTRLSGWQATLDRYRKRYQADGADMGVLDFSEVDVTSIGEDSALVRGRWRLRRASGEALGGLFTLIFRRLDGRWRIIHDHTSSE